MSIVLKLYSKVLYFLYKNIYEMNQPIAIIRKKMTFTEAEKKNILFGNVQEKQTDTYKKAKLYFNERMKVYSQIGKLSTAETKLWIDHNEYAVKMQFAITEIDEKKYKQLSKDVDKVFADMSQKLDVIFEELSSVTDRIFKKLEPTLDDAFKKFDEIIDTFFGDKKKTKK